ncbi:succinate dehydrogenase assembly factor 4, mitochondrial isoform X1 [Erinaceus europaeus]|uniref:Succinate dehydrogenase assembly factor 4, mitochondrial isoform X1 n=1 Tax=Erinaceus europaeus TaxID=9365 RepID=A0ABM3XAY7_ERIEU|nr:succinate dehydrogenase assembly factor 4, mitochondrial isoform X1 [Erinaceus europaeus]
MTLSLLPRLFGRVPAVARRVTRSPLQCHFLRKTSYQGEKPEPIKQSLRKPKLPEGRFDAPEDSNLEKEPLTNGEQKIQHFPNTVGFPCTTGTQISVALSIVRHAFSWVSNLLTL